MVSGKRPEGAIPESAVCVKKLFVKKKKSDFFLVKVGVLLKMNAGVTVFEPETSRSHAMAIKSKDYSVSDIIRELGYDLLTHRMFLPEEDFPVPNCFLVNEGDHYVLKSFTPSWHYKDYNGKSVPLPFDPRKHPKEAELFAQRYITAKDPVSKKQGQGQSQINGQQQAVGVTPPVPKAAFVTTAVLCLFAFFLVHLLSVK